MDNSHRTGILPLNQHISDKMNDSIAKHIEERKKRVDTKLGTLMDRYQKDMGRIAPSLSRLTNAEGEFVLRGGKRFRGILAIMGYEWHGGKNRDQIDQIAAAVELMHAALLVHDDIIDRDTHRRGRKTLHTTPIMGGKHTENRHRDLSLALLLGDHLATLGYQTLLDAGFPVDRKFEALHTFHEEAFRTGLGASMEIDAARRTNLPQERLERTERLKTASYTTLAPFRIGAVLAGKRVSPKLKVIMTGIGETFQFRDDLLGLTAPKGQIGKTPLSDLREGRITPLLQVMRNQLTSKEQKEVESFLKTGDISKMKNVLTILETRGVRKHAEETIDKKWRNISRQVADLRLQKPKKDLLLYMARQLIYRST